MQQSFSSSPRDRHGPAPTDPHAYARFAHPKINGRQGLWSAIFRRAHGIFTQNPVVGASVPVGLAGSVAKSR